METCREAIAAADGPIAAVGIANQRETTVLWDRATGLAVHNAIVWLDRRTAELCDRWREEGLDTIIAQRTGLVLDPYFSATKIAWLLDAMGRVPGTRFRFGINSVIGLAPGLGDGAGADLAVFRL